MYGIQKDEAQANVYNVYDKGETSSTLILLLKPKDNPDQRLPIWIAEPEANAIVFGVKEAKSPRPMTHDLCLN